MNLLKGVKSLTTNKTLHPFCILGRIKNEKVYDRIIIYYFIICGIIFCSHTLILVYFVGSYIHLSYRIHMHVLNNKKNISKNETSLQ